MTNRYNQFVIEADEGITFELAKKEEGILVIKIHNAPAISNAYYKNYAHPPVPNGYKYVCGEWSNGFVMERSSDSSQFVWIPVGFLHANGTLDEEHLLQKFGRRFYRSDNYPVDSSYEFSKAELFEQFESVKKYGGFYISRYKISKSLEGKPQSILGAYPWSRVTFFEAMRIAASMEETEDIKSHLTFGVEFDSILEWLIKSNVKSKKEIVEDSTSWGNYCNTENSPNKIIPTGSREEFCVNHICDLTGNLEDYTQEAILVTKQQIVVRGGIAHAFGYGAPVARRRLISPNHRGCIGFRVALCIK